MYLYVICLVDPGCPADDRDPTHINTELWLTDEGRYMYIFYYLLLSLCFS